MTTGDDNLAEFCWECGEALPPLGEFAGPCNRCLMEDLPEHERREGWYQTSELIRHAQDSLAEAQGLIVSSHAAEDGAPGVRKALALLEAVVGTCGCPGSDAGGSNDHQPECAAYDPDDRVSMTAAPAVREPVHALVMVGLDHSVEKRRLCEQAGRPARMVWPGPPSDVTCGACMDHPWFTKK